MGWPARSIGGLITVWQITPVRRNQADVKRVVAFSRLARVDLEDQEIVGLGILCSIAVAVIGQTCTALIDQREHILRQRSANVELCPRNADSVVLEGLRPCLVA